MRIVLDVDPFQDLPDDPRERWRARGRWPASWIAHPDPGALPHVIAYRRRFSVDAPTTVRVHVSADERYELYLDGARIGRGPGRGEPTHWYFETYDLALTIGEHLLVAIVYTLGPGCAPAAQTSVASGWLLSADPHDPLLPTLATGVAEWEALRLEGYTSFGSVHWSTGATGDTLFDAGRFAWGITSGAGSGFVVATCGRRAVSAATVVEPSDDEHLLLPSPIPAMLERVRALGRVRHVDANEQSPMEPAAALDASPWQAVADGGALEVPASTRRRVLFDLDSYVCGRVELCVSGGAGATVDVAWAEKLFPGPEPKSHDEHRDAIEGRYFHGQHDRVVLDGGSDRRFEPWWWRSGRYVLLTIETGVEPLKLGAITLIETRYPHEPESMLETSDARLPGLYRIGVRALQVCCHETYQDCPFYEQAQWVGDLRPQLLCGYVLWRDDRSAKKAIELVAKSRRLHGMVSAFCPARSKLFIPAFALWWVGCVCDYALFRGDREFVGRMMPDVRGTLDSFYDRITGAGVVESPPGWCFNDWADGWHMGVPPAGDRISGLLNWQLVGITDQVRKLEQWLAEPELAQRAARRAEALAQAARAVFWDESRQAFADDPEHRAFSEHTQAMALTSNALDVATESRLADALERNRDMTRARVFFSHWIFEALIRSRRIAELERRLLPYYDFVDRGFSTTPEHDAATRSDCHGWGAHPLFHVYTGLIGIRPAAFGFERVRVAPQLGSLTHARARMVHPRGTIDVDLRRERDALRGIVRLPGGVDGVFAWGGREQTLDPGSNTIG